MKIRFFQIQFIYKHTDINIQIYINIYIFI